MPEEMRTKNKKAIARCDAAVYGLGLIGALVYFIQQATSFSDGALGVLKAIVWPAMLVYHWLQFLQV